MRPVSKNIKRCKLPECYSYHPFLSSRALIYSDYVKDILNDSKINSNNKFRLGNITVCLDSVAKIIPSRLFEKYWLDGDNSGIMLHPYIFVPVWLNSDGIEFCRLLNGQSTFQDILEHIFKRAFADIDKSIVADYVSFMLLIRDLGLIELKGKT